VDAHASSHAVTSDTPVLLEWVVAHMPSPAESRAARLMPDTEHVDFFRTTMATFDSQAASHGPVVAWASLARTTVVALRTRSSTAQADRFVLEAQRLWAPDNPQEADLERLRIQVWQYLNAKNGNSTTIEDAEDRVLRCLIGMLFPFRTHGDVADTVEWSQQMGLGEDVS